MILLPSPFRTARVVAVAPHDMTDSPVAGDREDAWRLLTDERPRKCNWHDRATSQTPPETQLDLRNSFPSVFVGSNTNLARIGRVMS